MNTLIIGGSHDGGSYMDLPEGQRTVRLIDQHPSMFSEMARTEEYRVERMVADNTEFRLLVHSPLTLSMALAKLIEGYRPEVQP